MRRRPPLSPLSPHSHVQIEIYSPSLSLSPLLSSSRPFPAYRARVVVVVVCRLIAGRPGTFDAYAGVERLRETAATTDFKVA